jgi:hypothetical protein
MSSYQPKHKAAGILPYAVHNKKLYFFVGKSGKDGKITDLGGKIEGNETPKQTAVREFYEESSGLMGDMKYLLSKLRSKDLKSQFIVCGSYKIYIVKFKYNEGIEKKYNELFDKVDTANKKPGFFEMNSIFWIEKEDLCERSDISYRLKSILINLSKRLQKIDQL